MVNPCRDGGNTFTPERYRLELNSAHTFTGRQAPSDPHTVSGVFFLTAEGRRAECVCEAESELESVNTSGLTRRSRTRLRCRDAREHTNCLYGYVYVYFRIYIDISGYMCALASPRLFNERSAIKPLAFWGPSETFLFLIKRP